eukprot:COSAG06_NODE_61_length_27084_cov_48.281490_32_plen_42_part_00
MNNAHYHHIYEYRYQDRLGTKQTSKESSTKKGWAFHAEIDG